MQAASSNKNDWSGPSSRTDSSIAGDPLPIEVGTNTHHHSPVSMESITVGTTTHHHAHLDDEDPSNTSASVDVDDEQVDVTSH